MSAILSIIRGEWHSFTVSLTFIVCLSRCDLIFSVQNENSRHLIKIDFARISEKAALKYGS